MALNIDLAPTILELAGIEKRHRYQGRSLVPFVNGESPPNWRDYFFCEHLMQIGTKIPKWEGVRASRWVYARYFEQEPAFEFLHDLQEDPDQLINLADSADHAEVLQDMRQACDELRDEYGGVWSAEKFPSRK